MYIRPLGFLLWWSTPRGQWCLRSDYESQEEKGTQSRATEAGELLG